MQLKHIATTAEVLTQDNLKEFLEAAIPVFHGKSPRKYIPAIDLFFKHPTTFYGRYHDLVKRAKSNYGAAEILTRVNRFLDVMDMVANKVWPKKQYVHLRLSNEEGYILHPIPLCTEAIPIYQEKYIENNPHEVIETLEHSGDFKNYVQLFREPLDILRYNRAAIESTIESKLFPLLPKKQHYVQADLIKVTRKFKVAPLPNTTPPKKSGASAYGQFSLF